MLARIRPKSILVRLGLGLLLVLVFAAAVATQAPRLASIADLISARLVGTPGVAIPRTVPQVIAESSASQTAQPSRIATYDYGNWGPPGSSENRYPSSSLHELSWVQMGVNANADDTNYYHSNGVKTYSYGDEGLIYPDEGGPQRAWTQAMGAMPPPNNDNFYSACSNGGPVHTGRPAASIANPYFAFSHWTAAWQSQFSGSTFDFWYIDGLQEAGFKDTTGLRTGVCRSGLTYNLTDPGRNLISTFVVSGIQRIPNSKAIILCDCWGGDSGSPYISSVYPFGLSPLTAGNLPPTVLYYPAVAGGRSEGSYENAGIHNSLGVWQGVENMEIVTGNSHLYDFLQPWINEDSASSQGLSDRLFIIASIDLTVNCDVILNGNCSGYTVYQLLVKGEASRRQMCFYPDDVNCTHVYPEASITFANPFTAMPSNSTSSSPGCADCQGIKKFLSSNGTYFREYGNGFVNGIRVGRCVVVVNPDTQAHAWPTTGELTDNYATGSDIVTLQLRGANVDSGGSAIFTAGNAPANVASGTGVIVCDKSK